MLSTQPAARFRERLCGAERQPLLKRFKAKAASPLRTRVWRRPAARLGESLCGAERRLQLTLFNCRGRVVFQNSAAGCCRITVGRRRARCRGATPSETFHLQRFRPLSELRSARCPQHGFMGACAVQRRHRLLGSRSARWPRYVFVNRASGWHDMCDSNNTVVNYSGVKRCSGQFGRVV